MSYVICDRKGPIEYKEKEPMIAKGSIKKNAAGYWNAKLETGHPDASQVFVARAQKRMKDAIALCNKAAKKLGWTMDEAWAK